MAEANPKPTRNDGSDPPKKKNTPSATAAAGGSRPSKHPDKSSGPSEVKIEDTATSKPNKGEVEEINLPSMHIMGQILGYKEMKGKDPCANPDNMREFCTAFIRLNVGNARGWIRKLREIKNKFNIDSAPTDDRDREEFEMWKKIWGNDDDPSAGSST